ncbi:MAG: hypothetical protein J6Q53_08925 [Oscillospiraceae bacterium]|nr:hypothetical protein [Oscillospiraceae bacterium]
MRSFEQRIAEINRRSEEIIRKRRRSRRVLAACAPLLCVVLCAVLMLSGGANNGAEPGSMKEQGSLDGADPGRYPSSPVVAIKLTSNQGSYSYDDPQELDRVLAAIDVIFGSDQILGGVQGDPSKENNGSSTDATLDFNNGGANTGGTDIYWGTDQSKYTIHLVHKDGTVTRYTLQGLTLKVAGTEKSYDVPEDALVALRLALGIDQQ